MRWYGRLTSFFLLLSFLPLAGAAEAELSAAARQVIDASGFSRGVCIHLGSGTERNPGLSAELASGDRHVHGIALDEASLARARVAIVKRSVSGLVRWLNWTGSPSLMRPPPSICPPIAPMPVFQPSRRPLPIYARRKGVPGIESKRTRAFAPSYWRKPTRF